MQTNFRDRAILVLADSGTNPLVIELLAAFEAKLLGFLPSVIDTFKSGTIRVGLEKQGGPGGEIGVSLLASEMRDFCLLDRVTLDVMGEFADFFLHLLERTKATKARIGPLSGHSGQRLCGMLQGRNSNFVFEDVVLSVEPLLDKKDGSGAFTRSLQRAHINARKVGWTYSGECLSASEMRTLHEQRWGSNRPPYFFDLMKAFADEPYCDCISVRDSNGDLIGQQIDFCFVHDRYYYYSVARWNDHPGLGTALLAESMRRFYEDPNMSRYSFGRGGEEYKYRYAQRVRLNHYIAGFRTNNRELWR